MYTGWIPTDSLDSWCTLNYAKEKETKEDLDSD